MWADNPLKEKKWEAVIDDGASAVIFLAGLDEFNMVAAEDKSRTKMSVAIEVFGEVLNSEKMKGVTKLLFLNKVDLFKKKMETDSGFKSFKSTFPDYSGEQDIDQASDFISDKFRDVLQDDEDYLHVHVMCALDTGAMAAIFEAVKEDIFLKKVNGTVNLF